MYQFPEIDNEDVFQEFSCDLFNSIFNTHSFKVFGKKGHKQKGIDIFSTEFSIVIQCKKKDLSRKELVIKKELMDEIENEPLKSINDDLKIKYSRFIIVSTYKDHPELHEYCSIIKEKHNLPFEIEYWGWNTISKKIEKHKNIISQYFSNFDLSNFFHSQEDQIRKNLEIKRNIVNDFPNGMQYVTIIVENSNSDIYPKVDINNKDGISPWFKVNAWGIYHNGIEIIASPHYRIIKDIEGYWDFLELNDLRADKYEIIKQVYLIGKIPFANIIEYDINGDNINPEPHFYCHFRNNGQPYEDFEYLERHDIKDGINPIFLPLDMNKQRTLPLK